MDKSHDKWLVDMCQVLPPLRCSGFLVSYSLFLTSLISEHYPSLGSQWLAAAMPCSRRHGRRFNLAHTHTRFSPNGPDRFMQGLISVEHNVVPPKNRGTSVETKWNCSFFGWSWPLNISLHAREQHFSGWLPVGSHHQFGILREFGEKSRYSICTVECSGLFLQKRNRAGDWLDFRFIFFMRLELSWLLTVNWYYAILLQYMQYQKQ